MPQGTVIDVSGRASTALRDVRLAATAATRSSLRANDHAFAGRFAARKTGRYAWIADGTTGPIADVPPPLELEVVPDSAPRVELVSPATDTIVAGDDSITLRATATDDHGLATSSSCRGASSRVGQRSHRRRSALAESAAHRLGRQRPCSTSRRAELKPGDALHVKIVATDNSPWAQRGESRELLLKIPTLEERRAIARDAMDSAVSQVKATAAAEKSLQQRTTDAARDRTANAGRRTPPPTRRGRQAGDR